MTDAADIVGFSGDWQSETFEPAAGQRGGHQRRLSLQSGLPLRFGPNGPAAPVPSVARSIQLSVKGALDPAAAALLLIVLSPLLLLIVAAIRLTSPGPVIFAQSREGLEGRPIRVLKFRTMRIDACDPSGVRQTINGDTRVTAIGALLRRTNLDELPQLINVICGDMSLVGPRPHPFGMQAAGRPYAEHVSYYAARLKMKPGITGWAQCNGLRGPTAEAGLATARIDHDVAYIQNFSLALDIRILFRTLCREALGGTGL